MEVHPFPSERLVGVVCEVEGSVIGITLPDAAQLPRAQYGERMGRGEVGEFLIVDVGGCGVFGRVTQVGILRQDLTYLHSETPDARSMGRVQLLSTLELSGKIQRGVLKYPRVGDPVYSASDDVIKTVITTDNPTNSSSITIGKLSVGESVEVQVPLEKLFGRHTAIVGATGSGKSWTLAHLIESVFDKHGKLILIDATGEFHTLGDKARHLSFSSLDAEPLAKLVALPHFMMREADRNAFLNPSAGAQLPKLRDAVRTLRLCHAVHVAGDPTNLLTPEGQLIKMGKPHAPIRAALVTHAATVEKVHAPFDIKQLAFQVEHECVYPTGYNDSTIYGLKTNDVGYVTGLVSRINDLLVTPEIMEVIDPAPAVANVLDEIDDWIQSTDSYVLRISLRNLTFANHLREILVNIIGQFLLGRAREGKFSSNPVVTAIDEAHQFFNLTVGDEFASTTLNAFDLIAKEGRKYGLTVCIATQRPGDLPTGVLSQVGVMLVHRLAEGRDRERVEKAAAELDLSATRLLPGLVPGEAIFMGADLPVPVSVRVQRPAVPPSSDGPSYSNWVC